MFYDTEIYIPVRVYYSPVEDDEPVIDNIEIQEKVVTEKDELKTYVLKHHPITPYVVRLIIKNNTLNTDSAIKQEIEDAAAYKAEQKYDEMKEDGLL